MNNLTKTCFFVEDFLPSDYLNLQYFQLENKGIY